MGVLRCAAVAAVEERLPAGRCHPLGGHGLLGGDVSTNRHYRGGLVRGVRRGPLGDRRELCELLLLVRDGALMGVDQPVTAANRLEVGTFQRLQTTDLLVEFHLT